MKQIAEAYIEKPVQQTILTVPFFFTDKQRQLVKDCAQQLDLNVLRVLNHPTAALIGAGLHKDNRVLREITNILFV